MFEHVSYHSVLVQGLLRDQRADRLLYSACFAVFLSPSLYPLHVNHRTGWCMLPKKRKAGTDDHIVLTDESYVMTLSETEFLTLEGVKVQNLQLVD